MSWYDSFTIVIQGSSAGTEEVECLDATEGVIKNMNESLIPKQPITTKR